MKERKVFFVKKNGLKSKTALTLAVLGALCPTMGGNSLFTEYGVIPVVEAASNSSVGEVSAFAKDSNPKGYLLCDGRAVSRTEYAELFAEIGTKYGAGDGRTTFNLPKLTDGRFIEGSTSAGTYHEAGLPNITGSVKNNMGVGYLLGQGGETGSATGAMELNRRASWDMENQSASGGNSYDFGIDASKSNPIYGKSSTVQPNALTMRYYIKATKTADGGDGKVQSGDGGTISGDTAYNELRPTDGNYVKKNNTTASNLKALDTQVKANADNIVKAESNAKAYSDQKLAEAENRAKADATNKANAAEAAAKADATNKANAAQTNAINTATQKVADAEARAKADATNKANAAQSAAAQDATNKANAAQSAAAQDATKKANAAETNAKSYTDIVTEAAKTYAKTYTDEVAKGKANISMDNINEAGKNVIRDLAKEAMKGSGINTDGPTIVINKPMETKDIHVDGEITTTGGITAGGDVHGKGDLEIDGKTYLHGDTEIDKNLTVHGNERIDGSLDVGGDSHIHGNQTVDGDSHVKGNETIDKDLTVHGNEIVDGTLHVKDNAEFDKNVTVHGSETVDKDLTVKGDTTIGDSATDKLTVNATSEFKADATFDKNVRVKGSSETDGNSTVHGNSSVDGDLEVKGNTTLGDDKTEDVVDVNAKTNLHGDTTIGDSSEDKLTVNAASEFKSNATFDKDVRIKGNAEVDKDLSVAGNGSFGKDLYVAGTTSTGALISRGDAVIGGNTHAYGDIILDGRFFTKGAALFGDNVDIAKNLNVGGNTYIAGDAKVDGDIYGRSFNVGNERYIDKDGVNANGHKVRNVADGEISEDSLDAVNGRQLHQALSSIGNDMSDSISHMNAKLTHNISEVAAGAAAMANLHPLEYNQNDKVSVSAAVGSYKSQQALAIGAFYRPDRKTLVSISGSLGNNDNMIGVGVSKRLGQVSEIEGMTEEQLRDKVEELNDSNKSLKDEVSMVKEQNQELSNKNSLLETSLSEVKNAYNALMAKVDGLMDKIGLSNTAEK